MFKCESFKYIVFGLMTTFLSLIIYFLCFNVFRFNYIVSNTFSNIISIIFAFVVNKIFVFGTKTNKFKEVFIEFIKFGGTRYVLFILENLMLIFLIDYFYFGENISKIFTTFIVVVTNYFVSKFFVFVKK